MSTTEPTPARIFISYSHRDRKWLDRLHVHLKPLERIGRIDCWDDTQIQAGQRWRDEIKRALTTSKIAVLLVSADFLASDLIAKDILPPLLTAAEAKNVVILSVILGRSRFEQTPSLSKYRTVNKLNRPLSYMKMDEREGVWVRLADEIDNLITAGNEALRHVPDEPAPLSSKQTGVANEERTVSDLAAIRKIILPNSLKEATHEFVVAASPLSWRMATYSGGGWRRITKTISDYVGIRGLMHAFGSIRGMQGFPELVNPDDFSDEVLEQKMHLYLIGSSKANRWTRILMKEFFNKREIKWAFRPDPESENIRNPKVILTIDGNSYSPLNFEGKDRTRKDFGIVLRGPNPYHQDHMLTILAGRGALGTEAASLAVTNPFCVKKLLDEITRRNIDPEDHQQAFLAVVSVECKGRLPNIQTAIDTFRVWDVTKCQ